MRIIAMALLAVAAWAAVAGADELELRNAESRRLEWRAFRLESEVVVGVDAVGIRRKFSSDMHADAWLMDEAGRLVWSLAGAEWEHDLDERYLVSASDRIRLRPGVYVAWLFTGGAWQEARPFAELGRVFNDLADALRREDPGSQPDQYAARCLFRLTTDGAGLVPLDELPMPHVPIVLAPVPNGSTRESLVRVHRRTTLKVAVLGEQDSRGRGLWDLGWIEDVATGEPAWIMTLDRCEHAGGDDKNVRWSGEVELDTGTYRLGYATDSSYGWEDWRRAPPRDPRLWGLVAAPIDPEAVTILSSEEPVVEPDVVVRWLRVGDDVRHEQDVTFDHDVRLRIDALGEGGRRDMYDGGRILDLADGSEVWSMTWGNTEPGGGDRKNRAFHGEVALPAGSYRIVYATDDSHAFGSWNVMPPRHPFRYGMVIRRVERP